MTRGKVKRLDPALMDLATKTVLARMTALEGLCEVKRDVFITDCVETYRELMIADGRRGVPRVKSLVGRCRLRVANRVKEDSEWKYTTRKEHTLLPNPNPNAPDMIDVWKDVGYIVRTSPQVG